MTRKRKWLLGCAIAAATLVVLLALALAWLLTTPSGLRFALDRGVAMTHGQFSYASANGTLAGTTTVTGLRYRDSDGTSLRIDRSTLELQPWALLGRRLHVRKARIDGIALDIVPAKSTKTPEGFSMQPPLTISVDDALLTRIAVRNSGKPVFAADSLAIAGTWSDASLAIRKLALRAANGNADLVGTFALARGYPGRGKLDIDWTQDGTRYTGTLTAQSNGKQATLHAALSAPFRLEASGTLALDKTHAWTMTTNAPSFDARALPALPSSLRSLALDLHGNGDARGGTLSGSVTANGHVVLIDPARFRYDGNALTLDPLRLRSPAMPGVATANGMVQLDATPLAASLDAQWQGVQLPADLVGQPLATHGNLRLAGSAQHFTAQGTLAIGPPGKLSNLKLDLSGTPEAITLNSLQLVQQHGGLDAHGSIGLQPQLSWKVDAIAKRFDPGALLAGWNGALDFALASSGKLTPQGPLATLKLDRTGGNLRGRNIAGSRADLAISPGNWLQGSLLLVAGGSRIEATGQHGPRTNASIALDVTSLDDWLPGAAGQLHGRFTVNGTWPKLAVAGQLEGTALSDGDTRIHALQLVAAIPDFASPGGDIQLDLDGVHAAGMDFDSVRVKGNGSAVAHQLNLVATGKPLGVTLSLQGSWQAKTRKWTGSLSDVELTPQGMPSWRQQQPSALGWRDGVATLSQFCLSAGAPRLCLSGGRDAKGVVTADYSLQELPLQLFASLLGGADPLLASGDLSGSGKLAFAANGNLDGHATLAASAGSLAFTSTAQQPLLAWTGVTVDANATGGAQHATLRGVLSDGGHIDGNIDVSGSARALAGNLSADLRSLAFISALSPEVANVKGSLAGNLQLGGTLSAPHFQGRIQTQGFSAELPRAGLKLHDGEIAVAGDPQGRLSITGRITSGDGVLRIDGSTGLATNAPLTLALQGDNVLVADIPAAHVLASPDLHIARSGSVFSVTGSVAIPRAKVEVEKLPGQGPTKASPDVVIVDAPPPEQVAPLALNADIDVKLGNAVKVEGYGLDGTVGGQLAVQVRPGQTATGRGQITVSGKYQAYGQDLDIERGRLLFAGTRLDNPGLDIRAVRTLRTQDVTVGLSVRGTAQRPVLSVFSNPAMEQAEALSYLVTGRSLNAVSSGERDTLNTAAQALGGLAGDRLAKTIGARLGLEAGVSSSEALGGTAFTAGKYLSPRLFLSYGVGLFTPGQVITLRYTLNRFLQFEAENATTGNRASFNYKIEK